MPSSNPLAALRSQPATRSSHSLLFVQDGRETFRIPAPFHSLRIGRGADCDIRLPDPGRVLSRLHLVMERRPGSVAVRDCSTNGSLVNGSSLRHDTKRLTAGDRVTVGPWEIRVEPCKEVRGPDEPVDGVDSTTLPLDRAVLEAGAPPGPCLSHNDQAGPIIVGRSPAIRRCLGRLLRLATFDLPVVVCGETGTGKELVARALHENSTRARLPYVAINCGAIHRETANSLLFGHEAGAFTGAAGRHKGIFEQAGNGTLFLDEVAELSLEVQAALLRVLETGELRSMGGTRTTTVRCRLVAATHRDLRRETAAGRFREDLYYRLQVATIRVPPLRDRGADTILLAEHFLRLHGTGAPKKFDADARAALGQHTWPGNVRELRNVVLRALICCEGAVIGTHDLEFDSRVGTPAPGPRERRLALPPARLPDDLIHDEILRALHDCGGNRSETARLLGISRSTLYARMERVGLVTSPRESPKGGADIVD